MILLLLKQTLILLKQTLILLKQTLILLKQTLILLQSNTLQLAAGMETTPRIVTKLHDICPQLLWISAETRENDSRGLKY